MQKCDVLIIGGGIVGLTLACALAQTTLSIVLVDHQAPPQFGLKSPYDIRVSAIHHASAEIFKSIKIWEAIQQLRVSKYQHMRVWDAGSPAQIEFDSTEIAQPYLGYIVEHSVMRQTLWQQLQTQENVQIHHSAAPYILHEKSTEIIVQLNNNIQITTQLLVGADGKDSWVAKQTFLTNIAKTTTEYALVTTLRTEYPHQHTALQRFLLTGPIALLPLENPHLVSLVWSTTQQEAACLQTATDAVFNQTLTQKMECILGQLSVCDERVIFPLIRHQAEHYVKPHIALVGDAAHTILPLAGQGLNLGLLDAACLAQIVTAAFKNARDIGAFNTLRPYERWRKGENSAMQLAMEGFYRLFSSTTESARCIRHTGFAITQKLPWIKRYFMQRAMGLRGELPDRAKFSQV